MHHGQQVLLNRIGAVQLAANAEVHEKIIGPLQLRVAELQRDLFVEQAQTRFIYQKSRDEIEDNLVIQYEKHYNEMTAQYEAQIQRLRNELQVEVNKKKADWDQERADWDQERNAFLEQIQAHEREMEELRAVHKRMIDDHQANFVCTPR